LCRADTIELFSEIKDDSVREKKLIEIDEVRVLKNNMLRTAVYFDKFSLHSHITGCDHYLRLIDNKIDFIIDEFDAARLGDFDVKTPLVTSLNVPSKQLVFTNFFDDMGNIPEEEKYVDKYSVGSVIGRRNLRKYLAETHNLGYGQTSSRGVELYGNGKEILGLDFNLKYVKEMFYGDSIQKIQPLINRLKTEKFKYFGSSISCVWRIDFVDAEQFKRSNHDRAIIRIPIKGTKVEHHHYDNDCLKTEFGEHLLFSIKCV
jgi:hypothetical protein